MFGKRAETKYHTVCRKKLPGEIRCENTVPLPDYQWEVFKHFTPELKIQICSPIWVFSVRAGYIPVQNNIADAQYEFMKNNLEKINSNLKLFWISQGGKEDIAWKNCQTMLSKFDELKIKYTYSEYPGGHTWPVWRNNLFNFAQLLFK